MEIKDALTEIAQSKEELFIKARDKGHAESMRVTAFNYRRQMPEQIKGDIGIQVTCLDDVFYLRIFDRHIDGAEVFKRDKDGKLVPVDLSTSNPENKRIAELMRKDGKSEEEIEKALKGE